MNIKEYKLKIDSSVIGMESARKYRETSVTFRRFTIKEYEQESAQGGNGLNTAVGSNTGSTENAEESETEKTQQPAELQDWQNRLQMAGSNVAIRSSVSQALVDLREATIRHIFDILFAGRRNRMKPWMQDGANPANTVNGTNSYGTNTTYGANITYMQIGFGQTAASLRQQYMGWNGMGGKGDAAGNNLRVNQAGALTANMKVLNYSQDTLKIETEETAFSTVGTVRTADGREINFNVNVGMSREFQQHFVDDLNLTSFKMCDPLVINLNADALELSDQTFYFDIDADGEMDEISQLGSGSGYLALDKNGDGQINDGSELFGTASGNGFADLAEYDEDGNGWIDENDAVWDKLKIWCRDENGNDVLYKLADKGVGAICLQNVSTNHTLKGQEGQTKGAIRNTGIFLYENGNVGTVQHVDVAKYDSQA